MLEYFKLDVIPIKDVQDKSPYTHLFTPTKIKCKKCGKEVNRINKMLVCEWCGWYEIKK